MLLINMQTEAADITNSSRRGIQGVAHGELSMKIIYFFF